MVEAAQAGKSVARVYAGDPAMYVAILEQISLLGIGCEIVPGVSSVFAAAAVYGARAEATVILTRA